MSSKARKPQEPGMHFNVVMKQSEAVSATVTQSVLITTPDRVELCLRDHDTENAARSGWQTPAGMLAGFAATIFTADFPQGREWVFAAFVLATIFTSVWLARELWRLYRAPRHEMTYWITRIRHDQATPFPRPHSQNTPVYSCTEGALASPAAGAYRAGKRVVHQTFGNGVVVGVDPGDPLTLKVVFPKIGVKRVPVSEIVMF